MDLPSSACAGLTRLSERPDPILRYVQRSAHLRPSIAEPFAILIAGPTASGKSALALALADACT